MYLTMKFMEHGIKTRNNRGWPHLSSSTNAYHRALEACKRANNEMAAVVQSHSTRFLGVALLPTGHLKGPGKEDEEDGASHEKDGMDILMEAYKHAVETCSLDGVALFVVSDCIDSFLLSTFVVEF